jgi:hypothetical protein
MLRTQEFCLHNDDWKEIMCDQKPDKISVHEVAVAVARNQNSAGT